ncbi:helix-turn-helix domain-containing protein [Pararhizobium sp. YC-54]|uniref:helix-turn-helix domain-containing protein n=1 Tax=Pararhizobium sp. YC-54 TaxID=2986920 RepID=UPI0021F78799|nr:helix-turn-helix transcriptional regulator [Pararhizobium sp. YC-54]MCV9999852.1 helix-turn-helix domain-containing protein [Pararhizobium sp. YC-54]
MIGIDTAWFHRQLNRRNQSVRGLARFMNVDPSAVSRMLKGERKMSAEEQDRIAAFFGVSVEEVAAHRRGEPSGFSESKQEPYQAGIGTPKLEPPMKMFTEADIIHKDGKRWMEGPDGTLLELHPIFGCMKGTMTIPDDLDLTAPADPGWGKVYEDD